MDDWRKQYELTVKKLIEENKLYWSRFNISLAINSGLVVAFSTLTGLIGELEILGTFSILAIFGLGIFFSKLWLQITTLGQEWTRHYGEIVKNLEENVETKYRIIPGKKIDEKTKKEINKISASITDKSILYPKAFMYFWIIMTIGFTIYSILYYGKLIQ